MAHLGNIDADVRRCSGGLQAAVWRAKARHHTSQRGCQFARHPAVRHRVDPIRRHLEIESRVVAVPLDGLDSVSDVGETTTEVRIGKAGQIDVILQPVSRKLHQAFEKSRRRIFAA